MTEITAEPEVAVRKRESLRWLTRNLLGLVLATGIALVAAVLALWVPLMGAPVLAILLGAAMRAIRAPGDAAAPGLAFASKTVLQAAVVLLGFGISLTQVVHTGAGSLPVMLGSLVAALVAAAGIGRLLGVDADVRTLIGVGTGICGASAIAAVSGVIDAKRSHIAYAIATIFAFNVGGVVSFPLIGHLFGFSQQSFGLWAGTAINDTSSVVAAATVYGHVAAVHAVIVKLTRTTLIVPIVLVLAAFRVRLTRRAGSNVSIRKLMPWFIVWFLCAAAVDTTGVVGQTAHNVLTHAAVFLITVALAAIGFSADVGAFRRAGARPLLLGALVWIVVAGSSLLLQAATGQL